VFLNELREEISQGDIFDGIETPQTARPSAGPFPLLLLTNDCDIDRVGEFAFLLAVRVVPYARIDPGTVGNIRNGTVTKAMPLEGHPRFGEHFIDFREVHRIPRDAVVSANADGRRVASMTDDARLQVIGWFHEHLARRQEPRRPGERAPVVVPTEAPVPRATDDIDMTPA